MKRIGYREPMKAVGETYKTTNIMSAGGGYDPQGKIGGYSYVYPYETNNVPFAPYLEGQVIGSATAKFNGVKVQLASNEKQPYDDQFNYTRRLPGDYPLSKPGAVGNQSVYNGFNNDDANVYDYPEDLKEAVGLYDIQTDEASAPHQWRAPEIAMDTSERQIVEYFDELHSKEMERKIDDLRMKGYSEEEIRDVVRTIRRRDIEKELEKPARFNARFEDIVEDVMMVPDAMVKKEEAISGGFKAKTRYR